MASGIAELWCAWWLTYWRLYPEVIMDWAMPEWRMIYPKQAGSRHNW